jgi:O-antigen/teichoic acid export membrane protein
VDGDESMKKVFCRIWESSTFMTWGSFLTRSLSLVIVLPLLLTRLTTAEISLWYLFMTIIGFQMVVDMGFIPTFSRIISYLMGGTRIQDLRAPHGTGTGTVDRQSLNCVYSTMQWTYLRLGLLWTVLLVTVGSLALRKPVAVVVDTKSAWISWGIIVVVSWFSFQGNLYSSYLQGINQIALLRRWETITSLGGIVTSFVVLIGGGGLLGLVIANQGWQLVSVVCNRLLARDAGDRMLRSFVKVPFSREVFDTVWPSAWRSGLGIIMCYGLIQASGVIYAQVGETARVAMYLLGLRLIQTISQFSQAPFYSKIPSLSRLYAEGEKDEMLRLAQRGMRLSHWTYVIGFVALGIAGGPLLKFIGSNASFPEPLLWSLMGGAFFIERFGAMHIQLYSTTNHIIWHVVTGVSGAVSLIVSLGFLGFIGIYAFPIGIIAGYLSFYSWYSAICSYKMFGVKFLTFEKTCSLAPSAFMMTSSLLLLIMCP